VTDTPLDWLRSYLSDREQFVKIGQRQSDAVPLDVGVPQGSVLGPLLLAVYCSPVADVISEHGVSYHQYADDTQLRLSLRADNTAEGLAVLATCIADVRQWYLRNGLQLNPDKSEALIIGTTNQLQVVTASLSSVTVAGVDLPVADEMKVLGVVLDRRLSFDRHVTSVARACNYHVQAIRHIRHLLTTELALTLACSPIPSRLDYCNAVAWSSGRQYSEAAARAEHCRMSFCRAPGDRHLSHSSSSCIGSQFDNGSTNRLQTGCPDVQDPPHFHPGLPQPSHSVSHCHSSASLFRYTTSLQTYYQNQLRRPHFSLLRSCCLEFTNC